MYAKGGVLVWLAALTMCKGQEMITIGTKKYTKTLLLKTEAYKHMVISNDILLFINTNLFSMSISTLVVTEVKGLEGVVVRDQAIDSSGVVWLATAKGLYKIDPPSGRATFVAGKEYSLARIAITKTGTVYVSNDDTRVLYELRGQTLYIIPELTTFNIAFSGKGDLYFTKGWETNLLFSRKGGVRGAESTLAVLPSILEIWTLEVDIKSNILYIFTRRDLFYILPESKAVFKVSGVYEGRGLGSDLYGNIYLGTAQEIYKLSPVLTINDVQQVVIATSSTQEKFEEVYSKVLVMENIMKQLINGFEERLEQHMIKFTSVLTKQQATLEVNQKMAKEIQERMEKQIEDQRGKIVNDIRRDIDQKYSALGRELSRVNSLLQRGVCSTANNTESMDVFIFQY